MIEASRICAAGLFGVFWEVSATEGTLVNNGERFNELQVFRMRDEKRSRTTWCKASAATKAVFPILPLGRGIRRILEAIDQSSRSGAWVSTTSSFGAG